MNDSSFDIQQVPPDPSLVAALDAIVAACALPESPTKESLLRTLSEALTLLACPMVVVGRQAEERSKQGAKAIHAWLHAEPATNETKRPT